MVQKVKIATVCNFVHRFPATFYSLNNTEIPIAFLFSFCSFLSLKREAQLKQSGTDHLLRVMDGTGHIGQDLRQSCLRGQGKVLPGPDECLSQRMKKDIN
jgi:hypothetical protein